MGSLPTAAAPLPRVARVLIILSHRVARISRPRHPGRFTISTTLHGHTQGLRPLQRSALERLYRRTVPVGEIVGRELATQLATVSADLHRQVGLIIDRRGRIEAVIVGDAERLFLPDLGRQRAGRSRLRGVRLVHTHLGGERLTRDDLTDLTRLHLDLVAVVQVGTTGAATTLEYAHVTPDLDGQGDGYRVVEPERIDRVSVDFEAFIGELEARFSDAGRTVTTDEGLVRAIAVHVTRQSPQSEVVRASLEELSELARSAGVAIVETIVQRRPEPDPRYVAGKGKLQELTLAALQHDADLVIFDQDLSPSQARAIAETIENKVIDRSQLILDIFAQRATSLDGKLQVELAQLKYTLPRLTGKNSAMSRLTGGIGGRGPGETKLEIDRRRAKDRIVFLQKKIDDLGRQRHQRRARRVQGRVPVAAVVGYTNAGKSTLLNALTGAEVFAEDKLFATLDPTSRRLRYPDEVEFILTDTVGFIRDLPEDLVAAFKATLEEVLEADLLLHVVDVSQPGWERRIESVRAILKELKLPEIPTFMVFNKCDLVDDPTTLEAIARRHDATTISAHDRTSLSPLSERLMLFFSRHKEKAPHLFGGGVSRPQETPPVSPTHA